MEALLLFIFSVDRGLNVKCSKWDAAEFIPSVERLGLFKHEGEDYNMNKIIGDIVNVNRFNGKFVYSYTPLVAKKEV